MPKPAFLLKRGSRYYSNMRVPRDLVDALGKDKFFESLKTSDLREACERLRYRLSRYQAEIDEARRKLASMKAPERPEKRRLTALSESDAFELAIRYLVTHEERGRKWIEEERPRLAAPEVREAPPYP